VKVSLQEDTLDHVLVYMPKVKRPEIKISIRISTLSVKRKNKWLDH
jgi:hypothetical protein